MPAHDVSIRATFQKTTAQLAWEKAIALIEAATFAVPQDRAGDATDARYPLANLINELIRETGFVISPYDIVVFGHFLPATAGDADNPFIPSLRGTKQSFCHCEERSNPDYHA